MLQHTLNIYYFQNQILLPAELNPDTWNETYSRIKNEFFDVFAPHVKETILHNFFAIPNGSFRPV